MRLTNIRPVLQIIRYTPWHRALPVVFGALCLNCKAVHLYFAAQAALADHAHELRDSKRTAEERASEIKSHAKRELDALKAELAAANTSTDAALKVCHST